YKNILSREQLLFMQEEIYAFPSLEKQMQAGQQFFLLKVAQKPIGFFSVTKINPAANRWKLNKLYLLPGMQGKGLGRDALEAAAAVVKAQQGKVLELNVNKYNPAKTFYERCGFIVIREEDIPIGDYWMNDFVLEKQLT
ncbi:MAG TPA: GNAT family N-acetyltransferase, partial [Adhaeribacter sp.]|nr:GNAT family N-acetyltransferase [Adhaeribacter sp.]